MAHFAEIDSNNNVLRVLVVDDSQEHRGQEFLANDLGLGGIWLQTSYNNNIRKNFAGFGMSYNVEHDAFIHPKPFESWILNDDARWEAPTASPQDGNSYTWNESTISWELAE